jgi:hypothetical protein
MTASTPRIPRNRPLLRPDRADMGATLAAEEAMQPAEPTPRAAGMAVALVLVVAIAATALVVHLSRG